MPIAKERELGAGKSPLSLRQLSYSADSVPERGPVKTSVDQPRLSVREWPPASELTVRELEFAERESPPLVQGLTFASDLGQPHELVATAFALPPPSARENASAGQRLPPWARWRSFASDSVPMHGPAVTTVDQPRLSLRGCLLASGLRARAHALARRESPALVRGLIFAPNLVQARELLAMPVALAPPSASEWLLASISVVKVLVLAEREYPPSAPRPSSAADLVQARELVVKPVDLPPAAAREQSFAEQRLPDSDRRKSSALDSVLVCGAVVTPVVLSLLLARVLLSASTSAERVTVLGVPLSPPLEQGASFAPDLGPVRGFLGTFVGRIPLSPPE